MTCIVDAPLDGCASTDFTCLCESSVFIDSVQTCVESTCTGDDLTNAETFITDACDAAGVTSLPTPTPTAKWAVLLPWMHVVVIGPLSQYQFDRILWCLTQCNSCSLHVHCEYCLLPLNCLCVKRLRVIPAIVHLFTVNIDPNEVFRVLFD